MDGRIPPYCITMYCNCVQNEPMSSCPVVSSSCRLVSTGQLYYKTRWRDVWIEPNCILRDLPDVNTTYFMFYMVTVLNGVLRWARLIPIAVINLLIWLCLGIDPIDLIELRTRNEMFHNVLQIRCWLWTSDTGVSVPTSGPNDVNPPPVYNPPPCFICTIELIGSTPNCK